MKTQIHMPSNGDGKEPAGPAENRFKGRSNLESFVPDWERRPAGYNFSLKEFHRWSWRGIAGRIFAPFTRERDTVRDRRAGWMLLGTLLQSGTPVLMALKLCAQSATFPANRDLMLRLRDAVNAGDSMVTVLEAATGISPCEIAMVRVGEETGQMPETLRLIGELPDEERLQKNPQLALLSFLPPILDAGLPLLPSLRMMRDGYSRGGAQSVSDIISQLAEMVRGGKTFGEALSARAEFDAILVSFVKAGERAGLLPDMLRSFAQMPDKKVLSRDPQLALVSLLAPLVSSRMPLVDALEAVRIGDSAAAKIAGDLARSVLSGSAFSEALAKHPEFDTVAVTMVRAGELGGVLDLVLRRLRDWMLADYRRYGYAA